MVAAREFKFETKVPDASGVVVAMCEYKGTILLACQFAIYQLTNDNQFKKLEFIEVDENGSPKNTKN